MSDARNIGLFITVCFPCGGLWRRDLPIGLIPVVSPEEVVWVLKKFVGRSVPEGYCVSDISD
jgi:hypothetical protein